MDTKNPYRPSYHSPTAHAWIVNRYEKSLATPTQMKLFIQEFFAAMSGHDKPETLLDRYTTDPNLKQSIACFEAAFPEFKLLIEDMLTEGERVAVCGRLEGVHKGSWMGLAPTGRPVNAPLQMVCRLEGGKIAEHWMVWDRMQIMAQLGVAG